MQSSWPSPTVLLSESEEKCSGSCTVPTTVNTCPLTPSVSSGRVSWVPSSTGLPWPTTCTTHSPAASGIRPDSSTGRFMFSGVSACGSAGS